MLHVIHAATPPYESRALRSMFEARKTVFVDLLGWDVPVRDGRYEIDQFDDAHCVYLILSDADGLHLGSARLLPTMRPHILDSLFPDLCAGPVPRGPDIYEITRFCLARDLARPVRRAVRDTLVVALAEHALAHGIGAYTAIAERAWARQIERFGWRTMRLGRACDDRGSALAAMSIAIDPYTPAALTASGLRADPGLVGSERRAAA